MIRTDDILKEKIAARSHECDREILAIGYNPFGVVIAGLVLVGPNSIQLSHMLAPDFILDANLN